jgi:hypothetical protein
VIDQVLPLIDPTRPLKSATQVVDFFLPSIDPILPLKSLTKVVNLVPSSVDLTPHSKSEDLAQVYLINIFLPKQGGALTILMAPPSSNHLISIN